MVSLSATELEAAAGCAVQIWSEHRHRIRSEGSATAIARRGEVYLLTANHVLGANRGAEGVNLFVADTAGDLVPLEVAAENTAIAEDLDIAVLRLTPGQVETLAIHPLPLGRIYLPPPPPGETIGFVGYPTIANKPVLHKQIARRRCRLVFGRGAGALTYSAQALLATHHIAATFDRKRVVNLRTKRLEMAAKPYGMSGGPVFMVRAPGRLTLVGIGLEWRAQECLLVGGLVRWWFAAIKQRWT